MLFERIEVHDACQKDVDVNSYVNVTYYSCDVRQTTKALAFYVRQFLMTVYLHHFLSTNLGRMLTPNSNE